MARYDLGRKIKNDIIEVFLHNSRKTFKLDERLERKEVNCEMENAFISLVKKTLLVSIQE